MAMLFEFNYYRDFNGKQAQINSNSLIINFENARTQDAAIINLNVKLNSLSSLSMPLKHYLNR